MNEFSWDQAFLALFDRCVSRYRHGDADYMGYYAESDLDFLRSIGHKPREVFDFVEDVVDAGEPSREAALLVAAVRRDFFLHVQNGVASRVEMQESELPARDATLGGFVWLPRILQKARNKLRGENSPEIMYGCGGDRRFLKEFDIHPADFLRVVWAAREDDNKVVAYVRKHAK